MRIPKSTAWFVFLAAVLEALCPSSAANADPWESWGMNKSGTTLTRYDGPEYESLTPTVKLATGLSKPAKWVYEYVDTPISLGTLEFLSDGLKYYRFSYVRPVRILSWDPAGSSITAREPFFKTFHNIAFESILSSSATNRATEFQSWRCHAYVSNPQSNAGQNYGYILNGIQKSNAKWIDVAGSIVSGERHGYPSYFIEGNLQFPFIKYIGPRAYAGIAALTSVAVPEGVTHIEEGAFEGCPNLASVTLPSTLVSIGDRAFAACPSLAAVDIPVSVTNVGSGAFCDCPALAATWHRDSRAATCAGDAFENAGSVSIQIESESAGGWFDIRALSCLGGLGTSAEVVLPVTTTSIAAGAYRNATNVPVNLVLPNTVTNIAPRAFAGSNLRSVRIPCSVREIGDEAFRGCPNLRSVVVEGPTIRKMGKAVFSDCTALESAHIQASTNLGYRAFANCKKLERFQFPDGIELIDDEAFDGCSLLCFAYFLEIPEGTKRVGNAAFRGCVNLPLVLLPSTISSFGDSVFRDCFRLETVTGAYGAVPNVGQALFKNCISLKNVKLSESTPAVPGGVKSIGREAFRGCWELEGMSVPSTVETIGKSAFGGCWAMKDIAFPASLRSIGDGAFLGCMSLNEVTIPPSVQLIGQSAFGCNPDDILEDDFGWGDDDWYDAFFDNEEYEGCPALECVVIGATDPAKPAKTSIQVLIEGSRGVTDVRHTGATFVDPDAFRGCKALQEVTIGANVRAIGSGAFSGCSGLKRLEIKGEPVQTVRVTKGDFSQWTSGSWNGTIWGDLSDENRACDGHVPLDINPQAFESCSSLERIHVPARVIDIGERAFCNCQALASVEIDNGEVDRICGPWVALYENWSAAWYFGVQDDDWWLEWDWETPVRKRSALSIGEGAFAHCPRLANVTLPDRTSELGAGAFAGDAALAQLTIPAGTGANAAALGQPAPCEVTLRLFPGTENVFSLPAKWLSSRATTAMSGNGGDYEAAAMAKAANGRPVWECYVADLDPEMADDDLKVSIEMVDGKPRPFILSGESTERKYETQGAPTPTGPWGAVADDSRFFRVKVSLP